MCKGAYECMCVFVCVVVCVVYGLRSSPLLSSLPLVYFVFLSILYHPLLSYTLPSSILYYIILYYPTILSETIYPLSYPLSYPILSYPILSYLLSIPSSNTITPLNLCSNFLSNSSLSIPSMFLCVCVCVLVGGWVVGVCMEEKKKTKKKYQIVLLGLLRTYWVYQYS